MKTANPSSHPDRSIEQSERTLIGSLFCCLCFLLASSATTQAENAQEAARYFQEGRYDDALEIYRLLALENPDDPRLTYNAGVAAFRAGQYTEAMEQFDAASLAPDLELQQQAHYNMGNTLYRAGESTEDFKLKSETWKNAMQRYQNALTINEADTLAQDNLNFVKKRLEELEQQQQEQQQDQEQNQDENENEEESDEQQQQDSESDEEQEQNKSDQQNDPEQQQEQEQDQQGQDQQQEEQQQDPSQSQQEQEQEKEQQQDPSKAEPQESDPKDQDQQQALPREGKMTPEQAKQLLDAERDQAKAMIFQPPENKKSRKRRFKDW